MNVGKHWPGTLPRPVGGGEHLADHANMIDDEMNGITNVIVADFDGRLYIRYVRP